MSARLVLVGAPGAGKSAVAAALGSLWNCAVRDTDADYEAAHDHSVADAIVDDETRFRTEEESLALAALAEPGAVVALGSGALGAAVREALRTVPVVWLEVGLAEAAKRTGLSGMRPMALGNVRGQLHRMMQEREGLYRDLADIALVTDGREVTSVAEEIEQWEAGR